MDVGDSRRKAFLCRYEAPGMHALMSTPSMPLRGMLLLRWGTVADAAQGKHMLVGGAPSRHAPQHAVSWVKRGGACCHRAGDGRRAGRRVEPEAGIRGAAAVHGWLRADRRVHAPDAARGGGGCRLIRQPGTCWHTWCRGRTGCGWHGCRAADILLSGNFAGALGPCCMHHALCMGLSGLTCTREALALTTVTVPSLQL